MDAKTREINTISLKLQVSKDAQADCEAKLKAFKEEMKREKKNLSDTVLPRLKYLEAYTKKLLADKAALQEKVHSSFGNSQMVGSSWVKPCSLANIDVSFGEMVRDGF